MFVVGHGQRKMEEQLNFLLGNNESCLFIDPVSTLVTVRPGKKKTRLELEAICKKATPVQESSDVLISFSNIFFVLAIRLLRLTKRSMHI